MDTDSIEFPDEVINADDIDVEEIMAKIRAHIAEHRLDDASVELNRTLHFEGRFGQDVYDELFQAMEESTRTQVTLHLTETHIPVIGPLLDAVRRKVHELVVFYLNKSVARQAAFNQHIVRSLSALIEDLEQNGITREEFDALEDTVNALNSPADIQEDV